jgi:hypothetical protein
MTPVFRRLLIVGGLTLFAVAGVLLFEAILTPITILSFGRTPQGQVTGWIGLAVILLVFGYPIRKRTHQNRRWPHRWLQIHMVAGVVGPLIIILHAGVLHMHAVVPILAMVAMGIVVGSRRLEPTSRERGALCPLSRALPRPKPGQVPGLSL